MLKQLRGEAEGMQWSAVRVPCISKELVFLTEGSSVLNQGSVNFNFAPSIGPLPEV